MATIPHDVADLLLAPVALAVDARIASLSRLGPHELRAEVALCSNHSDSTRERRESGLLITLGDLDDLHGWVLSLDPRGVRLAHGQRSLVLGLSESILAYLEDPVGPASAGR
jgi:hypothetical protein